MWHLKLSLCKHVFLLNHLAMKEKFFLESTMKTFINLKVFNETIKEQDSFQTVLFPGKMRDKNITSLVSISDLHNIFAIFSKCR